MLIQSKGLPISSGDFPWGTVILAVVIIGGVGYLGYQTLKMPDLAYHKNPKS